MTGLTRTYGISANLISRENVPIVWPLVREKLNGAIVKFAYGELSVEDLFDSLICGKSQLWIVNDLNYSIRLIGVTKILQYPKKKRALIDILAGKEFDSHAVTALLPTVEQWAQGLGATQIEVHARPGLAKLLQRTETFNQARVVMIRELKNADISETQREMGQSET